MDRLSRSLLVLACASPGFAQEVTLRPFAATLHTPRALDFHTPSDSLVVSFDYLVGAPVNFARFGSDGTHAAHSDALGFHGETRFVATRTNHGGFTRGDLFLGNGMDGEIARVTDGGATAISPWVSLPGAGNGFVRGALHHDRTGVFDGDLIVATTAGEVWRVKADGTTGGQPFALLGTTLAGVVTLPNDPPQYGVFAGKILVGAPQEERVYVIDPFGTVASFDVGISFRSIELVEDRRSFFGVTVDGRLVAASSEDFTALVGDLVLVQEDASGSGLYALRGDQLGAIVVEIPLSSDSISPGGFRDGAFALGPLGDIVPIPDLPTPSEECALVFGRGPGTEDFPGSAHVWPTLLSQHYAAYDVTLDDFPEFVIPSGPPGGISTGSNGASGTFAPTTSFAVQIVLWNPGAFPNQPEQYTGGLLVDVGPDGTVSTEPFGDGTGMEIWAQVYENVAGDTVVRFPFSVPGIHGCTSYCTTSPNSAGATASVSCSGSVSIEANDFTVSVTGGVAGQAGVFYYGPEEVAVPFGNGVRCIGPGASGLFRFDPVVLDANGVAAFDIDYALPPELAGEITAGSTWNFQFWYRDPAAGGAFFNLSDAVRAEFIP